MGEPDVPNTDSNPFFAHSCCNLICVLFIVYCVCLLFAPLYHKEFLVGENLLGSKNLSDSDSDNVRYNGMTDVCVLM